MTMNTHSPPKLACIQVENLRLRAFIGFLDWEKEKLQDVIISFSFKYDIHKAAITDEVAFAVNYKPLTKDIISMVDNQRYHLIERMAETIYEHIQKYSPAIEEIEVKVEKPRALRYTDNVLVKISDTDRYKTALIALGSNISPEDNMRQALLKLQQLGFVIRQTKLITTKPLKFTDQPDFLNRAVLLQTKLSLTQLRFELKQMETLMERIRTDNKNAPRTIDADVLTYNGIIVDTAYAELPFQVDFIRELQPEINI